MIDDQLMEQAMKSSGLKTKKAVVEEALRLLIKWKNQSRVIELKGKVKWEGDLESSRLNS